MTEVTVIICAHTLDRWSELNAAVLSVRRQSHAAREILVVIDHNDELLARAGCELSGATVIANAREPGLSGGRMTGADRATAPILAFLDDDAIADPDWLREIVAVYAADPNVLGVGGPVEPLWRAPRPGWFPGEFLWVVGCTYEGMPVKESRIRNPIGANMSLRADVLRQVGGFAIDLGRQKAGFSMSGKARTGSVAESCEETEICIRAKRLNPGGYFVYQPKAVVQHCVPAQRTTWWYFVNRCLVEGAAKAILTDITGPRDGLDAERQYVRKVLPWGVVNSLRTGALGRAGAILAGLGVTTFAYVRTRLERRRIAA
ncbi:glycosyltransferase [Methylobacterium sp. NI91]|nr:MULTISPECIES: glycosyltransferase family 2 protein [unclassified Methylobacterium]QIJ73319.1 glycosyltransferase [Methylobacterium sp. CLZ]QIJ78223.1 glycosyltransferase [Methylobacterium sp. NI91]